MHVQAEGSAGLLLFVTPQRKLVTFHFREIAALSVRPTLARRLRA